MRIKTNILVLILAFCQCCYGQHWQSLGGGLNRYPTEMYTDTVSNKLYVGGNFNIVDGHSIWGIASWNGSSWDSLGSGLDHYANGPNFPGNVYTMLRHDSDLMIGGNFRWVGDSARQGMANWSQNEWSSVIGGPLGAYEVIADIKIHNGELYVCGVFDSVGSIPAMQLAKWSGVTWQSLGPNYAFGSLSRMCFYNNNLYVSGSFVDPNGNTCRLAKWDGLNWTFMTNILTGSLDNIWSMEVYNDELYISGLFYTSSGNAGNSIMKWNDTTWSSVGGGAQIISNPYPTVCDMTVHHGKLYCVGNFEKMGGVLAHSVAVWDGTVWCGLGTYFDNKVTDIEFYNDTMYIAGGFTVVDTMSISYVAKWIGGSFVDTCGSTTRIVESAIVKNSLSIFPNPSSSSITITSSAPNTANTAIEILDATGKRIDQIFFQNSSTLSVNCAGYAEGIYLLRMISEGECVATEKLVIAR